MINQIQDETGAEITIEDDGTIYVGATDGPAAEAAGRSINAIANPTMPKVGERYLGTVVKTDRPSARSSRCCPARTACCTSRKLRALPAASGSTTVEDVVNVGDKVQVEIAEIDDRGKLSPGPGRRGVQRRARRANRRRRATVGDASRA